MSMRAIGLGFLVNCCFVILTFLFTASSVNGQTWEVFDMANAGLPSNTVNAFAHEDNGTTWVGTDWGLCKYDGSTWEVFQVDNSDIPENDVRALALDDQNSGSAFLLKVFLCMTVFLGSISICPIAHCLQ